jgi:hypothetical protein
MMAVRYSLADATVFPALHARLLVVLVFNAPCLLVQIHCIAKLDWCVRHFVQQNKCTGVQQVVELSQSVLCSIAWSA